MSLLVGAQAVTACSSPGSTPEEPDTTASDIREDQFVVLTQNAPRVLADDPPDLMRLPQMSELATDGLLLNLDSYAEDFGRDAWPASQLEQMRGDDEGRRGDGPLYAMGVNAFPLQALMASYGDPAESNDWVYQKPDATIVTPSNLEAGVSAGGGLAAATALLARERGGPRLAGQMLICPMLDDRNDSASARRMAGVGSWDRSANATGWRADLAEKAGGPDVPADAAPARATDLSGLPPTFVDVGSAETFRDEAVAYASRLWLSGGRAELHVWPGGTHAFDYMVPEAVMSRDARAARLRWLTRLLASSTPVTEEAVR